MNKRVVLQKIVNLHCLVRIALEDILTLVSPMGIASNPSKFC